MFLFPPSLCHSCCDGRIPLYSCLFHVFWSLQSIDHCNHSTVFTIVLSFFHSKKVLELPSSHAIFHVLTVLLFFSFNWSQTWPFSMKSMVEGECGGSNPLVSLANNYGQTNERVGPSVSRGKIHWFMIEKQTGSLLNTELNKYINNKNLWRHILPDAVLFEGREIRTGFPCWSSKKNRPTSHVRYEGIHFLLLYRQLWRKCESSVGERLNRNENRIWSILGAIPSTSSLFTSSRSSLFTMDEGVQSNQCTTQLEIITGIHFHLSMGILCISFFQLASQWSSSYHPSSSPMESAWRSATSTPQPLTGGQMMMANAPQSVSILPYFQLYKYQNKYAKIEFQIFIHWNVVVRIPGSIRLECHG